MGLALLIFFMTLSAPLMPTAAVSAVFNVRIDTTLLTYYFLIFCTLYNMVLLTVMAIYDRSAVGLEKEAVSHRFSIMIPARNEESVVGETLNSVLNVDYPSDKFDVLVIDDGSTDRTFEIAKGYQEKNPNVSVLKICQEKSGRGKSAALNSGYEYLLKIHAGTDKKNWLIGVFDADGRPKPDILKKASYQFQNEKIGAIQTLVRIKNRSNSFLTKLQDVEFVTFSKVTQFVRNIFHGAVALGGNGQFVRATALDTIYLPNGQYWRFDSLTEDLDLGTRIILAGWENSFLTTTSVEQQGVESFGALYKQRTRWSWGALQTFKNYMLTFKVFKPKIGLVKKLDLAYYLSCQLLPPLVLLTWVLSLLSILHIIFVYNPFPAYFMIANGISFFPVIGFGLWTARRDYSAKLFIPLLVITNAYTYHWIVCTFGAMIHILKNDQPKWVKTARLPSARTNQMLPLQAY